MSRPWLLLLISSRALWVRLGWTRYVLQTAGHTFNAVCHLLWVVLQMLVDDIGDVTITNDGATILKLLEVEHPAAKVGSPPT